MPTSNLLNDSFNTLALTLLDNEAVTETVDGAELTIDSNSSAGTMYSYSKTTAFTGTEADQAAEIMANGVPMVAGDTPNGTDPETYTTTYTHTGQDSLTPYYAGWVQDAGGGHYSSFLTTLTPWTFTRSGTYSGQTGPDSTGTIIEQGEDESVHMWADWNGSVYSNESGLSQGVLLEGERTQLLEGTPPAAQVVTVAAVVHTLSMTGTGSLTLSGVATGTATEGADLTFTPTAGALTVTVVGDVETEQLEEGAFASSWIPPSASAAVTRPATQMTATVQDLVLPTDLVNNISGQIVVRPQFDHDQERSGYYAVVTLFGSSTNRLFVQLNTTSDSVILYKRADNVNTQIATATNALQFSRNDVLNIRFRMSSAGIWMKVNELSAVEDSSPNAQADMAEVIATVANGSSGLNSSNMYQIVEKLSLWPEAKSDAFLEALT